MNNAIGFTAIWRGSEEQLAGAATAQKRMLAWFPELTLFTIHIGDTTLHLWGRDQLEESIHRFPDGSLLALIGSPLGKIHWPNIQEKLATLNAPQDFRLPWDGRVILLYVHSSGDPWILWNDWLGSIPVFHAESHRSRIASTLEPVVVDANRYSAADFNLPGIVTLLTHGNLLNEWTIFNGMKVLPPDGIHTWDENGFHSTACDTIQATDLRWETGWDDLIDEMHHLMKKAIQGVLQDQDRWTVPLSSGLDSRLIAAIGAETGADLETYTWGPPDTRDVVFSQQIARELRLPWKRIDLGDKYLCEHVQQWADLFGSAMHFHGMYQIPFLNALKSERKSRIISGFIGDSLGGYDVHFQTDFVRPDERVYSALPPDWLYWQFQELKTLFKIPLEEAIETIGDELTRFRDNKPGPWFQKIRFLTLWGRQNHFTYFQSMISDYWFGVATPYINRDYARFALSLPRAALDDRRLQIDMMRRYHANVMCLPGTYALEPAILTGRYLVKRRLAKMLPAQITRTLLPEFAAAKRFKADITSIRACQETATWPIPETRAQLSRWFNQPVIDATYQAALDGDMPSVRKLQGVQTIAYRLLSLPGQ